ncbi:hypothetical protein QA635_31945 [Bradyrhizobium brasilense]|uniref:hypothetical protein n=1 Tax=Bradyrhizobium brasilense TaxID=1419277 RepID=UPI0024B1AD31|nr:hypothetical protein [Bradyrhizobium australafricanum]WFU31146.1 hypothetical protein QA635_31945 [Bradyrhizobium australafricanum]
MVVVIQYACFGQYHQNVGVTPTRIGWSHIDTSAEHAAGFSEYLLRLFVTDPWILVEKKGRIEACSMNRSKAGPHESVPLGAVTFTCRPRRLFHGSDTPPDATRLRDGHSDIL